MKAGIHPEYKLISVLHLRRSNTLETLSTVSEDLPGWKSAQLPSVLYRQAENRGLRRLPTCSTASRLDLNIDKFLVRVKDKSDHVRLMGFGHRVYKNFDPRAKIIRDMCYRVLEKLGKTNNPLFDLSLKLEEIALKDEYFVSRKLYPNVDFYSGIIYSALGIPRSMFTVMFAIARTAGWVAQWQEMVSDPHMRIGRPRQLYTGPTQRDYQPLDKR